MRCSVSHTTETFSQTVGDLSSNVLGGGIQYSLCILLFMFFGLEFWRPNGELGAGEKTGVVKGPAGFCLL